MRWIFEDRWLTPRSTLKISTKPNWSQSYFEMISYCNGCFIKHSVQPQKLREVCVGEAIYRWEIFCFEVTSGTAFLKIITVEE